MNAPTKIVEEKRLLVAVRDISIEFKSHGHVIEVVSGVSFDIFAGRTTALVGESGSGKSVIARTIMGILAKNGCITQGQILFNYPDSERCIDIAQCSSQSKLLRSIRGFQISMIFQEPMVSLSPIHTIGNQISEAVMIHQSVTSSQAKERTIDMLDLVGFRRPEIAFSTYPFELSGGMRQRAMIAMALVCHPALLIADEPTTALDVTTQAKTLELISNLQRKLNMAVLLITHDLGIVANVADDVVVIYQGRVMERGDKRQVFAAPKHVYTQALLDATPHFDMARGEQLKPIRSINTEMGSLLQDQAEHCEDGAVILRVEDLSKTFYARKDAWSISDEVTSIKAVDQVSFEILAGECLGIVGESGSGKSTLAKLIARAYAADTGSVKYLHQSGEMEVFKLEEEALNLYRQDVQYIFQDPVGSLNPSMTVLDIIREPLIIHGIGDSDYQLSMVEELVKLVGLSHQHLRRYPHSFSGGQRQRIGIARALALKPKLLLCDEAVSALDVSVQAQVLNLLNDLREKLNLSYLFISHNLAVVHYVADRVVVMFCGKVVEVADRETIFKNPTHPYTQSLLNAIPFIDLDRPLDFSNIKEGQKESDWGELYFDPSEANIPLHAVNKGHWVRMRA